MIRTLFPAAAIPAQRTAPDDRPSPEPAAAPAPRTFHAGTVQDPGSNQCGDGFRTHRATATGGRR